MSDQYQLHIGDCLVVLRAMSDASVDAIVTDPPYHLTQVSRGSHAPTNNPSMPHGRHRIGDKGFMGKVWDGGDIAHRVELWAECLRVLKPGGHLLSFAGSRTYHRMTCAIEDAGFEVRDQIMWIYGSGFPKSKNLGGDWEGWGSALKPSHEPICMARKPLVGTVASNVQAFGTGALNIDGCRVEPTGESRERIGEATQESRYAQQGSTDFAALPGIRGVDQSGRWPANVIHDGSAEVLEAFPDAPGQIARSSSSSERKNQNVYGAMVRGSGGILPRADIDKSAARFFYCAKASRADRNEGIGGSDAPAVSSEATMRDREMADWKERNGNHHPTVKPTELMAYLCRLITPPGGVILDPFMGSGSTGKAALREGFRFIGVDMTPEYVEIAEARIRYEAERIARLREECSRQCDMFTEVA
jgi:site-specific DNA-methyltransferase (adenine-specific)